MKESTKDLWVYVMPAALFAVTACAALGGAPAEKPECSDAALTLLVAQCKAQITATENVTEKNAIRAECLERVDIWEKCE